MGNETFDEYKKPVVAWLRSREIKLANGDERKLTELALVSDDDLLKKWLWTNLIIAAPATFIAAPLLLGVIQPFLGALIGNFLWMLLKSIMGFVFILFVVAIYLTVKKTN